MSIDRIARQRVVFGALAVALVLFRSFVPTYYEGLHFDSDQAIVGLMATHLSRFHRFPLFYYGLNYMLGVEAWIIAPFFWMLWPSVALMRVPLVVLNAAVAVGAMMLLSRELTIRPPLAFIAVLPFIVPTPVVAGQLVETAGASVEPFVYILLLWCLRRRPLAFGALLAVGFLHREFTILALPALVLVSIFQRRWRTDFSVGNLARLVAGFSAVWLGINGLKAYLSGTPVVSELQSLGGQTCFDPHELPGRIQALVTECLPPLFGGTHERMWTFTLNHTLTAGYRVVGWMILGVLVAMVARLLVRRRPEWDTGLGSYLTLVGGFTAAVYPLSCNVMLGGPPLLRYVLLALLVPVGVFATFIARESSRTLRTLAACAFVGWAAANLFDNAKLLREAIADPPPDEHRALTDYLLSHHIRYARAIYWDAYVVDFLSDERVIVASTDVVRIEEYQDEVDSHPAEAVTLERLPCSDGPAVASWCIEGP